MQLLQRELHLGEEVNAGRGDITSHSAAEELKVQRGHVPLPGSRCYTSGAICTQFNFLQAADERGPDGLGSSPASATS